MTQQIKIKSGSYKIRGKDVELSWHGVSND